MNSGLQHLVGREVVGVLCDESLHLTFDDGSNLSVFGSRTWSGRNEGEASWPPGSRCLEVAASPSVVTLRFDDSSTFTVDLRDTGCSGPETMVLHIPNRPIVVWN